MVQSILETIVGKLTGPEAWLYLAIPITTGLIGWITNIVALKMTFRPLEFWGYPPYLGWQGILPRKAKKIARQFSDLLTDNLISISGLFERIDPEEAANRMEPAFDELIEPTLRNSLSDNAPPLWTVLPVWCKKRIHRYFRNRLPEIVENFSAEDLREIEDTSTGQLVLERILESDVSVESIVDDLMAEQSPDLWNVLPNELKTMVILQVRKNLPEILARVINDWKRDIDEIFDLKQMIVGEIQENRKILNDVFQKSGTAELTFIKRSGLYFGTFFGLFQMTLWMFYQPWWLLPLIGFFVGVTTNYIAIQLIFSPKEPYNLGLFSIQGFAFKRRREINRIFSRIVSDEILNVENTFDYLFKGPGQARIYRTLQKHVHVALDRFGGLANPVISRTIGYENYFETKDQLTKELMAILPEALSYSHEYLEETLQFEEVLRTNLNELNPDDYETIMRTPYKEDEWILILVGGVLGFTAGILQLVYLFGGNLPFF
ncbi:MAG: DUF445 domain-containing protein [bacterium]